MAIRLDIGCGPYKQSGYIGVDVDRQPGVDLIGSITRLPLQDDSIEGIYSRNTLEHIPEIMLALSELYRVCRHGATLELTVPHFSSYEYWRDLTHLRPFSVFTMDHFDRRKQQVTPLPDYLPHVDFELVRAHLHWWDPWMLSRKHGLKKAILRFINACIESLANWKPFLCERLWCWHVGGFVLVTYHLRVHKPVRTG